MNLHIINVIIGREYMTRVKKKSFLITTFLGPIFFAAMCILPSLIMFMSTDKGKEVAVIDQSGIVMPYMTSNEETTYTDCSGIPVDSMKVRCKEAGMDALVVISPLDSVGKTVSVDAYSGKPMSVDMKDAIRSRVNEAVENYRLESYRIDGLRQIIDDVKADVPVSTFTLDDSGEEKITSSEVYMIISLVLSIIIYMFIAMFSAMVMQSVIEEKSSRVVEVLVSSVKATELMFGKIIGVACVALTQFLLWVVLTAGLVLGVGSFVGFDSIAGSANVQTEPLSQMTVGRGVDPSALDATGMNMQVEMPQEGSSEMAAVLETVKDINYPLILISFVVYFVLGYLLYASLFAAIGSAVENEADTQQLQLPVTIPLLIAFFIAFYAFKSPDSQVVFWGSVIPFTSPIVMLARIPFGVPAWELALSIVLLVVTFVLIAYLSAKIYKIGILMFGKKTSFKDLYKWLKQK